MKAERKDEGETEFSPRDLPRCILSYEKIGKAGSKAARGNEVFPRGFFRMASCFGRSRRETGNFFSGSSGGGLPAGSTGDFPEKIFRRRFWGLAGFD